MNLERILSEVEREQKIVWLINTIEEDFTNPEIDDYMYCTINSFLLNNKTINPKSDINLLFDQLRKYLNNNTFPINTSEYSFIENYLESIYLKSIHVYKKTEEELISELKELVQNPNKNYDLMTKILKKERYKNLEDIIECSEFESENELFLTKLSKQGKVGTTYFVYNKKLGKDMVMKIVDDGLASRLENHNAANLFHHNIVRVSATGKITRNGEEINGVLMDYIYGEDLAELMDKNPEGLDEQYALKYSLELLSAIRYMISKGVEHRDLHLDNLRIYRRENSLKILDFGICESIRQEENYNEKYNRAYGGSNDLFSWALLTYKMFTGRHLLSDGEKYQTIDQYKDRIFKEKKEMRLENGTLKQCYIDKIRNNLIEYPEFQNPIIMALTNIKYLDKQYLEDKIEQEMLIGKDRRIISQLKNRFGEFDEKIIETYRFLSRGV